MTKRELNRSILHLIRREAIILGYAASRGINTAEYQANVALVTTEKGFCIDFRQSATIPGDSAKVVSPAFHIMPIRQTLENSLESAALFVKITEGTNVNNFVFCKPSSYESVYYRILMLYNNLDQLDAMEEVLSNALPLLGPIAFYTFTNDGTPPTITDFINWEMDSQIVMSQLGDGTGMSMYNGHASRVQLQSIKYFSDTFGWTANYPDAKVYNALEVSRELEVTQLNGVILGN